MMITDVYRKMTGNIMARVKPPPTKMKGNRRIIRALRYRFMFSSDSFQRIVSIYSSYSLEFIGKLL